MAFVKLPGSLLWLLLVVSLVSAPVSISLPFVVFHGVNDDCKGVQNFIQLLSNLSGSSGSCVEIGNGKTDSIFMPLQKQAQIACRKVKQMKELSGGYNIVGMSQGNQVARGLIQFCDGAPPVKNYVSLAGPHAGISAAPKCTSGPLCSALDKILKADIYSEAIQDNVAPSGYVKLPDQIPKYLKGCKYLPVLNNEKSNAKNSTYKDRFSSLQSLVLVMFESDTTLIPKETSWFGYYPDGAYQPVLPPLQTKLYTEDWIGLKTLNDAGKVKFVSVPGDHLQISDSDVKKHVIPYLQFKPSVRVEEDESPTKLVYDGSSPYNWPPSVMKHLKETLLHHRSKL